MSSTTLLVSLFNYKSWANKEFFTALRSLNQNEHKSDWHTVVRIMNHTYVVDQIFAANLQGLKHDYTATNTEDTPTLDELVAAVEKSDRWYCSYVAALSGDELSQVLSFTFVDGSSASMSREEMLAHVVTHGGYHRGAAGRILAQLSIAPPRDIFTRFLHATEPERRN
jgi:uncharacterized damage-inducible protein DinB